MGVKKKQPLDSAIAERGLAADTGRARPLIMAGRVVVNDHMVDKPGTLVSPDDRIRIKSPPSRYVSRGGDKLERALHAFSVPVAEKVVLDVGASTGGFTDCVLQAGAAHVFAVDVGYGQLAWKLQTSSRVTRLDRTHIKSLSPDDLSPLPDLAVIDASFISLSGILASVVALVKQNGELIALVKPQFEAAKNAVERGGIVQNIREYQRIIKAVVLQARALCLHVAGVVESPLRGPKGNREFFLYMRKRPAE